jgi:LmbE family N-acetylglucosaminyl deacetylase
MNFVAIGAHLDDVEIAAGGLLADAAVAGHSVSIVAMSDSSFNDIDGHVSRSRETALREGQAAARCLGATLEVLDFETKEIPHGGKAVEAIEKQLIRFKAEVLLTHWPFDTHQDHRATAWAAVAAARRCYRILMFEPHSPSGRSYHAFSGQMYYAVSADGRAAKACALRAHESQYLRYGADTWVTAVDARGMHHGFEIGQPYAECFEVMRWDLSLTELLRTTAR